jgi:hypothetical protein
MVVFLVRLHVVDEGSSIFGIFSTLEAAIAKLTAEEVNYCNLEDGEVTSRIVYNRTDGCFSLQVLAFSVQD